MIQKNPNKKEKKEEGLISTSKGFFVMDVFMVEKKRLQEVVVAGRYLRLKTGNIKRNLAFIQ